MLRSCYFPGKGLVLAVAMLGSCVTFDIPPCLSSRPYSVRGDLHHDGGSSHSSPHDYPLLLGHKARTAEQRGYPGIVVDIGAHNGRKYSLRAADLGFHVLAFEPAESNRALWPADHRVVFYNDASAMSFTDIREGLALWKTSPPVIHVVPAAVSNVSGSTEFGVFSGAGTMSAIGTNPEWDKSMNCTMHTVPLTTLTEVLGVDIPIFLLKTDTEGHELQVLQGARAILASQEVPFLDLEFWPWLIDHNNVDPLALLTEVYDQGFECFDTHSIYFGSPNLDFWTHYAPRVDLSLDVFVNRLKVMPFTSWSELFCVRRCAPGGDGLETTEDVSRVRVDVFGPWWLGLSRPSLRTPPRTLQMGSVIVAIGENIYADEHWLAEAGLGKHGATLAVWTSPSVTQFVEESVGQCMFYADMMHFRSLIRLKEITGKHGVTSCSTFVNKIAAWADIDTPVEVCSCDTRHRESVSVNVTTARPRVNAYTRAKASRQTLFQSMAGIYRILQDPSSAEVEPYLGFHDANETVTCCPLAVFTENVSVLRLTDGDVRFALALLRQPSVEALLRRQTLSVVDVEVDLIEADDEVRGATLSLLHTMSGWGLECSHVWGADAAGLSVDPFEASTGWDVDVTPYVDAMFLRRAMFRLVCQQRVMTL